MFFYRTEGPLSEFFLASIYEFHNLIRQGGCNFYNPKIIRFFFITNVKEFQDFFSRTFKKI